jgi:hypothetical protein
LPFKRHSAWSQSYDGFFGPFKICTCHCSMDSRNGVSWFQGSFPVRRSCNFSLQRQGFLARNPCNNCSCNYSCGKFSPQGIIARALARNNFRKEFLRELLRETEFARNSCESSCGRRFSQRICPLNSFLSEVSQAGIEPTTAHHSQTQAL